MDDKLISQISEKIAGESKASTIKSNILGLLLFIGGILWIVFSYNIIERKESQSKKRLQALQDSIKMESNRLIQLKDSLEIYQAKYIVSKGSPDNQKDIAEGVKADSYLTAIYDPNKIDKSLTIQYYRKTLDEQKVWVAISELGYKDLVEKAPKPGLENVKTNSIGYGNEVSLYDLKVILFTLLRAGSQIKFIEPYQAQNGREKVIQIYSFGGAGGTPVTMEEVINAKDLNSLIRR